MSKKKVDLLLKDIDSLLNNYNVQSFKVNYEKYNLKIIIPIFSVCGFDCDFYGQSNIETNFQNNMSLINLEEINKTIRKYNPVISSFKISNEFNDDCYGNGYLYTKLEYTFNDFAKVFENFVNSQYSLSCKIEDNILKFNFECSGASGGNCWGNSAEEYHINIDIDEIIKNMDNFMFNFLKVNLGNNSFRRVKHKLTTKHVSEYYGNYSNFMVFEFDLQDVYNEFKSIYDNLVFG